MTELENRKIRFRAWDKQKNERYKPVYRGYEGEIFEMSVSMSGDLLFRVMENGKPEQSKHESVEEYRDRYILMQYTGLHDKNGNEIYEGDILRHGNWMNPSESTEIKDTIVLWDGKECKYNGVYPTLYPWRMSEIIGNIYENPELLSTTKSEDAKS